MATKGKDKTLEGQIAFDFCEETDDVKLVKSKKEKAKNTENGQSKIIKEHLNIKHNHFKASRKIRRIPLKFKRR